MSGKAAQRLSRALATAAEAAANANFHRGSALQRSSILRIRAFAATPCFSGERFQEHRGSVLRYGSRHHFCNSTTTEKDTEEHDEDPDEALSMTVLKLQHDALEISSNGHPEKCAQASTDVTHSRSQPR